jgi:hypothetical protein
LPCFYWQIDITLLNEKNKTKQKVEEEEEEEEKTF